MTLGVLLFIGAMVAIIMIHEAGHLLVAKAFGFKATRFFLGFGPTLWSLQRGETEYGIKALPFGGFVKIVGMNPYEEVPPEDESRSYPNKPRWQRALVLVAGSATHFVVALVMLTVAAMTIGFPTGEVTNEIAAVEGRLGSAATPASDAGLRPGDRIVAVGGVRTSSWEEIRAYIQAHGGRAALFRVERGGVTRTEEVTLGRAIFSGEGVVVAYAPPGEDLPRAPEPDERVGGFLGVTPEPEFRTESFPGAVVEGAAQTWEIGRASVLAIDDVFRPVFDGTLFEALGGEGERDPGDAPFGLVGAGRLAGETVERGRYLDFIGLVVAFAVFVGIMNLLPLPPLDGGHLAVLGWEAVTGRTVDVRKLIPVAAAVISFFVVVFLAVLYLDLARPIRLPF